MITNFWVLSWNNRLWPHPFTFWKNECQSAPEFPPQPFYDEMNAGLNTTSEKDIWPSPHFIQRPWQTDFWVLSWNECRLHPHPFTFWKKSRFEIPSSPFLWWNERRKNTFIKIEHLTIPLFSFRSLSHSCDMMIWTELEFTLLILPLSIYLFSLFSFDKTSKIVYFPALKWLPFGFSWICILKWGSRAGASWNVQSSGQWCEKVKEEKDHPKSYIIV